MGAAYWTLLLCGLGTFALRWLPLWRARRGAHAGRWAAVLQAWLAGVGPAAIAALWVVSTVGVVAAAGHGGIAVSVRAALALAGVAAVRWLCQGGIAWPTLAGAAVYGLLAWV